MKSGSSEDVLIDISANNSARTDALKKEALSVFGTELTKGELNLVLTESDLKEHKRASSLGISTGEYKQIQYIKNKSENVGDNQYNEIRIICCRLQILPHIRITRCHNFWNLQDRERKILKMIPPTVK